MNRKVIKYLLIIASCSGLFSCSESEFNPDESASLIARYLASSESSLNYSAEASSKSIQVSTVSTNWSIANSASWVTVSPSSGCSNAEVKFAVSENISADTARAVVDYLSSNDPEWQFTAPISISQSAAYPKLILSNDNITFSGAVGTQTVTVTSNQKWTASANADWISITTSSDLKSLDVKVLENTTGSSRSGYVTLTGKITAVLNVSQAAAQINVSTSSLNYENTAGTYSLTLESEAAWTAKTSDNWIQITPESGNAGKTSMSISVSPNESISGRNGFVYLNIGGKQVVELPVHQDGLYISFEQSSITFNSTSEQQTLNVKSNLDWIVSAKPDWIAVSKQSGHYNEELVISATDNNSIQNRSGKITFSAPGLSVESSIDVLQNGKIFSVGNTNLDFSDKSGTAEVNIVTDGTWTATTNEDWISINPTTNTGNSTLVVFVDENTSDDERNGNVAVSLGSKTYDISVHQAGKFFNVPSDGLEYGSTGGVIHLSISTNDNWKTSLEKNSSWLTISPSEGSGSVDLLITAKDNPSVNERKDVLSVSTPNGHNVKVNILQKARYLSASVQSINFFAKGGTSELITISTDGKFQISKEGDWFTIQNMSDNSFTVTTGTNETGLFKEGLITIKLTDLQEGEMYLSIPVVQTAPGAKFDKDGYKEDVSWDATGNSTFTITNDGYSSDTNLDPTGKNTLTITLNGYNNDKDLDGGSTSSFTLVLKGYNGDNWWGTALDGSGILNRHGYGDDKNHDANGSNNGNIDKDGYGNDTNHDSDGSSNGAISRSNYNNDNNLDNID